MYVLEGEITAVLDGETHEVKAGSWVHMPLGVEHSFKNNSSKPTKMILTYSPGGFEKWFLHVGTLISDPEAPAPAITQLDVMQAIAAAETFRVTFHRR